MKVVIDNDKGLVQEPGSGLVIKNDPQMTAGQAAIRRKVISWSADKTLTAADSGALVFCEQQSTAIDLELPTAANAGAGWFIDVYLKTASSAAANIDFQADSALVFIHLADGHTDSAAATVQTKQSATFSASATVNSRFNIVSNGTAYYVKGFSGTGAELTVADTGV